MKAISRFLKPALFLALVGIVGATSSTHAQQLPAVGTRLTCNFTGTISISQNGQTIAGTVTGFGTFQVSASTPFNPQNPSSRNTVTYFPVAISARSTFAQLGTFTTSLGAGAATTFSSTTSLNPGSALLPVLSEMRYPAVVTGPGGTVYTSVGNVNFRSLSANSFNPFANEPFQLEGPVTFTSGPDGPTFTLQSLNSTFNN